MLFFNSSILDLIRNRDSSCSSKINSIRTSLTKIQLQKELRDIIDQINNETISNSSALQKIYAMYKKEDSDSGICDNLAQIVIKCIMEDIKEGTTSAYTVKRTLNDLYMNRSSMFKAKRHYFSNLLQQIKANHDLKTQILLGLHSSSSSYSSDSMLNEAGLKFKDAISYLKKFAND